MKHTLGILFLFASLLISGCTDKEKKESLTESGMKCGAGKCGASMVNGSTILVKKKMNILNQLDQNDSRRECVLKALSSKALYACVRIEKTGRLSTKCSSDDTTEKVTPSMKCEVGKCGNSM